MLYDFETLLRSVQAQTLMVVLVCLPCPVLYLLYCTVLHCAALYCTVQAPPRRTVLYCTVLHCTVQVPPPLGDGLPGQVADHGSGDRGGGPARHAGRRHHQPRVDHAGIHAGAAAVLANRAPNEPSRRFQNHREGPY